MLFKQNHRVLRGVIQIEAQGEVQLKGKVQTVRIFSVPAGQPVPPR